MLREFCPVLPAGFVVLAVLPGCAGDHRSVPSPASAPTAASTQPALAGHVSLNIQQVTNTVALTIDYSNGSQKHFSNIPWKEGMTILDVIEAAKGIPPGATVKYGSSRSGQVIGLVIDGLPQGDAPAVEWVTRVNAKRFDGRLGTPTSFELVRDREANLVKAGDQVLVTLSDVEPRQP